MLSWQNGKMTKWQIDEMARRKKCQADTFRQTKWQVGEKAISQQNSNVTKWQVASWWSGILPNGKLKKWQVDKMASGQNGKLTKCQADEMKSW